MVMVTLESMMTSKKKESFGEDKGLGKNPVSKQNFRFIHKR